MKKYNLLFILIIIFSSCKNNNSALKEKIGVNYNSIREKWQLVPVDTSFKFDASGSDNNLLVFVNEHEVGLKEPAYLRKLISLDSTKQMISLESDYFKNPAQKKYLISTHFYNPDSTSIVIQTIDSIISHDNSQEINRIQADSILRSWGISINPFKGH